ncbi:hypothetical protein [Lederbergia panacisoli]|uniref:hypothetical protein n=1 Tax=Lederbergia panacisoli TaxID=1255251 RepID=UPI00214C1AA4|nr:hypothetical protein [Lederbergia panacisoli]MCR2823753.1 hypothetical protein [Lederbergia panacisoli]
MQQWRPDTLLHVILVYVMASGFTFWLPIVRGIFDGSSYTWSVWLGFDGIGIHGDYWLLLIFTVMLVFVIYLGWRGAQKPFHWLLLSWLILLVIESGTMFFSQETIYFKGETLGTEFAIGKVIFPIDLLFLILSSIWVIRNVKKTRSKKKIAWRKENRILLTAFFIVFPIQLITLRFFDHNIIFDQVGVALTMLQWLLLNLAFYPWQSIYKIKSPGHHPGQEKA